MSLTLPSIQIRRMPLTRKSVAAFFRWHGLQRDARTREEARLHPDEARGLRLLEENLFVIGPPDHWFEISANGTKMQLIPATTACLMRGLTITSPEVAKHLARILCPEGDINAWRTRIMETELAKHVKEPAASNGNGKAPLSRPSLCPDCGGQRKWDSPAGGGLDTLCLRCGRRGVNDDARSVAADPRERLVGEISSVTPGEWSPPPELPKPNRRSLWKASEDRFEQWVLAQRKLPDGSSNEVAAAMGGCHVSLVWSCRADYVAGRRPADGLEVKWRTHAALKAYKRPEPVVKVVIDPPVQPTVTSEPFASPEEEAILFPLGMLPSGPPFRSEEPSEPEPTIVCLCGSTKFKQAFIEANFRETMAGKIVLSVGWFSHADQQIYAVTESEKARLDQLYLRKIDLADEVLILDVNRYIGDSTRRELAYAETTGKRVRFLSREEPSEPIGAAKTTEPTPIAPAPWLDPKLRKLSLDLACGIIAFGFRDLSPEKRHRVLIHAAEILRVTAEWGG